MAAKWYAVISGVALIVFGVMLLTGREYAGSTAGWTAVIAGVLGITAGFTKDGIDRK